MIQERISELSDREREAREKDLESYKRICEEIAAEIIKDKNLHAHMLMKFVLRELLANNMSMYDMPELVDVMRDGLYAGLVDFADDMGMFLSSADLNREDNAKQNCEYNWND